MNNPKKICYWRARRLKKQAPDNVKEYLRGKKTALYDIELSCKKEFMSLIWHDIEATRCLTPQGEPRMMSDVVDRFFFFEELKQCNDWFNVCCKIYNSYDADKFREHPMWLRPPNNNEREQSPEGKYYILDGCHRALAFAKLLQEKKYSMRLFKQFL